MSRVNPFWRLTSSAAIAVALIAGLLGLAHPATAADQFPAATMALQEAGDAWLGISVDDTDDGVLIMEVTPGSPAADAGLAIGHVIVRVDDAEIAVVSDLLAALATYAPGDQVTIVTLQNDDEVEYTVTLGERPADLDATPGTGTQQPFGTLNLLGLTLTIEEGGLRVTAIDAGSRFADSGLEVGDLITRIGDVSVVDLRSARDLMRLFQQAGTVDVVIERDGEEQTLTFDLPGLGNMPMPDEFNFGLDLGPGIGQMELMMLGLLGVEVSTTDEGLQIDSLEADSPLADIGFQEGDVVTAINGVALDDLRLNALARALRADEALIITVLRDGEEVEIELNLDDLNLPNIQIMPMQPGEWMPFGMGQPPTQLGVQYRVLTPATAAEAGIDFVEGALIVEVFDGTPAAEAGLESDDIVTAVDGDAVDEERTLSDRLYAYEEGDTVTLSVLRDGEALELTVTLGPNPRDTNFRFNFGQDGRDGRFRFGPHMRMPEGMFEAMDEFFRHHPFMSPNFDSEDEPSVEPATPDVLGQSA